MRRTPGLVAGVLAAALLAGCSGTSEVDPAPQSTSATVTSTPTLPTPPSEVANDATDLPGVDPAPTNPSFGAALSKPVEDSVYPDIGDPSVDALHYGLKLSWDPATTTLSGVATITLRSTRTADHLQLDLGDPLEVSQVLFDGQVVQTTHDGKDLVIEAPVVRDQRYVLDITYSGVPQPVPAPTQRNDFSTTGWTTTDNGDSWTMQEPYGAFTWYPVNDQPADKALYDITVSAPSPLVGVANGELAARDDVDGRTVTQWHLSEPASSYLVTLAISDYDASSNRSTSGTPISYWTPPGRPELSSSLQQAPEGLAWLERKLGPYPFDTLGFLLVDSLSGMETQTMITLGIADADSTDYTTSLPVLVHEMAHHWYGDEVTPSDWRDVWMNEGMAMYLQILYQAEEVDHVSPDAEFDLYREREQEVRAESGPPGDYDPAQFGASNIYYGPALMWHELSKKVGQKKFLRLVRAWPATHSDQSVDRQELYDWWEQRTGLELTSFFHAWIDGKTTPSRS